MRRRESRLRGVNRLLRFRRGQREGGEGGWVAVWGGNGFGGRCEGWGVGEREGEREREVVRGGWLGGGIRG